MIFKKLGRFLSILGLAAASHAFAQDPITLNAAAEPDVDLLSSGDSAAAAALNSINAAITASNASSDPGEGATTSAINSMGAVTAPIDPLSDPNLFPEDLLHPPAALPALSAIRADDGGLTAYIEHWTNNPQQTVKMRLWCEKQMAENRGVQYFDFAVDDIGAQLIADINDANDANGFGCYKIRPIFKVKKVWNEKEHKWVEIREIRSLKRPAPSREWRYKMALKARSFLIPSLGFMIISKDLVVSLSKNLAWSTVRAAGALLSKAFAKAGLELNFAALNAFWSVPFGQETFPASILDGLESSDPKRQAQAAAAMNQMIGEFEQVWAKADQDVDVLDQQVGRSAVASWIAVKRLTANSSLYFKKAVNTMTFPLRTLGRLMNMGFNASRNKVRASHFWLSAVNMLMWPGVMGAFAYLGAHLIGPEHFEGVWRTVMGMVEMGGQYIRDQFWMSCAFNFSFAIFFQEGITKARNLTLLDEPERAYLDGFFSLVFNVFRGISVFYPQHEMAMTVSQLAIGSVVSAIMLAKLRGIQSAAKKSGRIADEFEKTLSHEEMNAMRRAAGLVEKAAGIPQMNTADAARVADEIQNEAAEITRSSPNFLSAMKTLGGKIVGNAKSACDAALSGVDAVALQVFERLTWGNQTSVLGRLQPVPATAGP